MDSTGIASLYRQHHAWLLKQLLRRLGGQHAEAWDLVHDTFERVLRQPARNRQDQPRGYLGTIAKRLLIDRHRRRQIENAYLEALAGQPERMAPSPEAIVEIVEQLRGICDTLDRMPQRMRDVFLLARIEGLAYGDIAGRLGVSVNIVQKDMIQAWQRFYYALHG